MGLGNFVFGYKKKNIQKARGQSYGVQFNLNNGTLEFEIIPYYSRKKKLNLPSLMENKELKFFNIK